MQAQESLVSKVPIKNASKTQYLEGYGRSDFIEQKKNSEFLLLFVVCLDFLFLNISLIAILGLEVPYEQLFGPLSQYTLLFLGVTNLVGILVASFSNVYDMFEGVRLNLKIKDLFLSILIFLGIVSLIYYQFFYAVFEQHFLLPAFFSFFVFTSISHILFRHFSWEMTTPLNYAVVGGNQSNIRHLEKVILSSFGKNSKCIGQFSDYETPGVRWLGGFEDIEQYIHDHPKVDKLLYLDSTMTTQRVQDLGRYCRTHFIGFEVVLTEVDFFNKGTQVEQLAHLPILRRKKEPLCKLKNRILKRIFDVVFSLGVILLIFPWLFPIIALLIRLESKGPIFFIQYRTGYSVKPFRCVKFRSMKVNRSSDEQQAVKNDIRITKIGAFLRKTNLDELPQFFNVFWGDMSVVGPRPHMLKHTMDYSKLIDKFMIRHEVKPGITGWAQVSGWRGPTDHIYKMAKRVEFDVFYIENWSFWFDLKCVYLTVFNMFGGEENAF